ncbi:MAG: magnesium chelatase [Saprospiraceae bacterium]|nr:magnesium chelatase [Saprospiraceae bacterium]
MKNTTIGTLKKSGYTYLPVKEEIKKNLKIKLEQGEDLFPGIYGYETTVIPDIVRALLSGHNILFLGLRGQAKTKLARMIVNLLDDYIPVVEGSEINDHPFHPISRYAKDKIEKLGDETPVTWLHRSDRYVEKLATPDVSIADLLGDLDPIKALSLKTGFDNEYSIHYGLIPRSNRSIFAINELPDLQARIQVALLNILEENDIQIRGFKLKLPLDLFFVFTANPEDYTQRGNIITPLKDRIESQILTHYPEGIQVSLQITEHEAKLSDFQRKYIRIPGVLQQIVEQIAFSARESELIDEKSGVSARMSIAARELLYSAVERRMLINKEKTAVARLSDLLSVVPALTGKMELVFEGEQLGAYEVALTLINDAIQKQIVQYFPKVQELKKKLNPKYLDSYNWFAKGNEIILDADASSAAYKNVLQKIPGTESLVQSFDKDDRLFGIECLLHHIASANTIQKDWMDNRIIFKDQLASMLNDLNIESN